MSWKIGLKYASDSIEEILGQVDFACPVARGAVSLVTDRRAGLPPAPPNGKHQAGNVVLARNSINPTLKVCATNGFRRFEK